MKKKLCLLISLLMVTLLTACTDETTTRIGVDEVTDDEIVSRSYTADFYNNFGDRFLSVEGKTFSISPNKIKTYSWDSNGSWTSTVGKCHLL